MEYGIKYTSEFTSELGVNYKVRILQKDYNSAVTELVMGGEPVIINYNGDENKFATIRGSECAINFYAQYNYQFTEIVKADKNDFKIEILKNNTLFWSGFVIQDNYNEPFMTLPYLVTLRATDGLGDLKFFDFRNSNGNVYFDKLTQIEAILTCLGKLKNGSKVISSIDIYETRIDKSDVSNEALNRIFINPFVFFNKGDKVNNCADVLKSILEIYNAYIYYKEGTYHIERVNYKLQDSILQRSYNINFDGTSSTVNTVSTSNILRGIGRNHPLRFINNNTSLTFQTPYKSVEIENSTSTPSQLVLNQQFTEWEGTNLKYWENNGLAISKTGTTQAVPVLGIPILNGDLSSPNQPHIKLSKLNFNGIIYNGDAFKVRVAHYGNVRYALKLTNGAGAISYLHRRVRVINEETVIDYLWQNAFTYITDLMPDGTYLGDRGERDDWRSDNWYVSEITTPAIVYGNHKVEIFIYNAYNNPSQFGYKNTCYLREVSLTLEVKNSSNYEGQIYKLSSTKSYPETYEDFQPLFGEFVGIGNTNQLMINSSTGFAHTSGWLRFGKTESKSLFEIASKSILNQYREPYLQVSTNLRGDFDFGKVYNIDNLQGRFMPFKAQLNLKSDISNVEFFELLNEDSSLETLYNYTVKPNYGNSEYNIKKVSIPPEKRPRPYIRVG